MIIVKIKDGKFRCGFCGEIITKDVIQSKGNGRNNVSNQILCKCGRHIPQSNQIK